jgi:hypothetical protein
MAGTPCSCLNPMQELNLIQDPTIKRGHGRHNRWIRELPKTPSAPMLQPRSAGMTWVPAGPSRTAHAPHARLTSSSCCRTTRPHCSRAAARLEAACGTVAVPALLPLPLTLPRGRPGATAPNHLNLGSALSLAFRASLACQNGVTPRSRDKTQSTRLEPACITCTRRTCQLLRGRRQCHKHSSSQPVQHGLRCSEPGISAVLPSSLSQRCDTTGRR